MAARAAQLQDLRRWPRGFPRRRPPRLQQRVQVVAHNHAAVLLSQAVGVCGSTSGQAGGRAASSGAPPASNGTGVAPASVASAA